MIICMTDLFLEKNNTLEVELNPVILVHLLEEYLLYPNCTPAILAIHGAHYGLDSDRIRLTTSVNRY
jgi:hypothetical protein